jgi:hypothetical protein
VLTKLLRTSVMAAGAAGLLAGCGGDETTGSGDHTPVRYEVLVGGEAVEAPFNFILGETARVQLKFYNSDDEDLDSVEDSHFGGLTFDPASMVTVTRVSGRNYQFDVTGNTIRPGTVTVSYGHSEQADEVEFPAEAVNVVPAGGEPPQ